MDPKARGYELVESDTELWDDEEAIHGEGIGEGGDNDITDLTRESWEVSVITFLSPQPPSIPNSVIDIFNFIFSKDGESTVRQTLHHSEISESFVRLSGDW